MATTKTFDQYMAESGQQSTLDELRRTGKYDQAKALYERGGSAMSSSSSSGGGSTDWGSIYREVAPNYANMFGGTVDQLQQTADDSTKLAGQVAESIRSNKTNVNNIYTALAKQLQASAEREQSMLETEKKQKLGAQKQAAAVGGFDTTSGFEAAQQTVTEKQQNAILADAADRWQVSKDKLAAEQSKTLQDIETEAAQAIFTGNTQKLQTLTQIASLKKDQQTLITSAANAILNARTEQEKMALDKWYKGEALKLQQKELDLNAKKLAQGGSADKDALVAQQQQQYRQYIAAGLAEGKSIQELNTNFFGAGLGNMLTPDFIQQTTGYATGNMQGEGSQTGSFYTPVPQEEAGSGLWNKLYTGAGTFINTLLGRK